MVAGGSHNTGGNLTLLVVSSLEEVIDLFQINITHQYYGFQFANFFVYPLSQFLHLPFKFIWLFFNIDIYIFA